MVLNGLVITDSDPERYVRAHAADVLGTTDLDLTMVEYVQDSDGFVLANGRVVTAH